MSYRVQKWGNSNGVRIPNRIIITKAKRPKESLKLRIKNYNGSKVENDFTWDEAKGKEIW